MTAWLHAVRISANRSIISQRHSLICLNKLGTLKNSSGKNGVLIEHSYSWGAGAHKEFLSGVKGGNYVRSRKT